MIVVLPLSGGCVPAPPVTLSSNPVPCPPPRAFGQTTIGRESGVDCCGAREGTSWSLPILFRVAVS